MEEINKIEFERWADGKNDFKIVNGVLKWFNYDFWLLEKECQSSVFKEYLSDGTIKNI